MPVITTTNVLATTAVIAMSGPVKIVAESPGPDDKVIFYEETGTTDNYQKVPMFGNIRPELGQETTSGIFELYGNYKFLLGPDTNPDLVVSYVAG